MQAHRDHVHFNPEQHGSVKRVADWPTSTFHQLVEQGVYSQDWGSGYDQLLRCSD
jgi:putative transposase